MQGGSLSSINSSQQQSNNAAEVHDMQECALR